MHFLEGDAKEQTKNIDQNESRELTKPQRRFEIATRRIKSNPQTQAECRPCIQHNNQDKILMLTDNEELKMGCQNLCKWTKEAMKAIRFFAPNLMILGNNSTNHRFTSIFSKLISSLVVKSSPLQHMAGALLQISPALILQRTSNKNGDNKEADDNRLNQWKRAS